MTLKRGVYYWYWGHNDSGEAVNPPEVVRLGPEDYFALDNDDEDTGPTEAEFAGHDVPREMHTMHGRFQRIDVPTQAPPITAVLVDVNSNVVARWLNPVLVSRLYKSRDMGPMAMISADPNMEPTKAIKPREFVYAGPNNGEHVYKERV